MKFQKWAALSKKTDWLKELLLIGTRRLPATADLVNLLLGVRKSVSGGGAGPGRILKTKQALLHFTVLSQLKRTCLSRILQW